MLPLDHIRVLEPPRLAPGPHYTMILADLGANVIRVEEPGSGRRASAEVLREVGWSEERIVAMQGEMRS